tara:strand:+ start:41170 stop:41817 length:648 start_codon:yes stop_codon:yes gene_type:complete
VGARGTRIDAVFRDQIRDQLNITVAAINAASKTHSGSPGGDPNNNPFVNNRPISGSYSSTTRNGVATGDGSSQLGAGQTVRTAVTSAEIQAAGVDVAQRVSVASVAGFIRTVFSTLSRYRNYTIQKNYNNFGTMVNQYGPMAGQIHLNFDVVNYAGIGPAFPGVGSWVESQPIIAFIDALALHLANDRAANPIVFVETWCHSSCHGSCHGARGRR